MTIIEQVKNELLRRNQEYIEKVDSYDFWNNHIKFVVDEALKLASVYGADKEMVELGALLHDIALVSNVGTKADHHTNGAKIAEEILTNLNYPQDKKELVKKCVLNHRSSREVNRNTIEEQCVADADAIAHFDRIPSLFSLVYKDKNMPIEEGKEYVKRKLERDYEKLSPMSRELLKDRYEMTMKVLFI